MGKADNHHLTSMSGKVAAFFLVGLLSACGSGSGSSGGGSNNHEDNRPGNTTFTRAGLDVIPGDIRFGGDLGASIDSAANITFTDPRIENHAYPYNFTFASGLPGGSIRKDAADLVTFVQPSTNKQISILTPLTTRNVQNVFWFNADNPGVYGFGEAGYLLNPNKSAWPTGGTVKYRGQAFQYVVDSNSGKPGGYALFTSEANATLDYAAHTLVINIQPGANQRWITPNSSAYGLNGQLSGTSLALQDLDFTQQYLFFQTLPFQKSGLGLGLSVVDTVNFFGTQAQELAGVVEYSSLVPDLAAAETSKEVTTNSGYTTTFQTISFALTRQ